jgi:ferrochelatase
MARIAVVLFNLGGPDSLATVKPFLFNLFNDAAILRMAAPLRYLLARLISARRAPIAQEIYKQIGGRSPIVEQTEAQARALDARLGDLGDVQTFLAMRYWHPLAADAVTEVRDFAPDHVVLLPLYPQFSTTTTASSLADWRRQAAMANLRVRTVAVGCYPVQTGLVAAQVDLIRPILAQARAGGRSVRLLFSAHGLPQKIVDGGDPYQWQVEQTVAAVVAALGEPDLHWSTCYQSKVGRLQWIGPSTEQEIAVAGQNGDAVVVVPIAFVSEHSETLVELDIDYRDLAERHGVAGYFRVPAVATHEAFIDGLADLVRDAVGRGSDAVHADGGHRLCPAAWPECGCVGAAPDA